ncbi:MAG: right-handed parallel beta-helix repeat-containing protein, partial [Pseudomonadota bacterium]
MDPVRQPLFCHGDITVNPGITLTLEPGTKIVFLADRDDQQSGRNNNKSEIIIKGRLIAQGTSSQTIVFTSSSKYPERGDWHGLFFSGGEGVIDYAVIQYAYDGIYLQGASPVITNSTIFSNANYGIYSSGLSNARIEGNTISENNSGGIYCGSASDLRIDCNTLSGNSTNGIHCYQSCPIITGNTILNHWNAGICCEGQSDYPSPVITNNTLMGNGNGITGNHVSIAIRNNVLRNQSDAIALYNTGDVTIEFNTVAGNGRGIYCSFGQSCTIEGNVITHNLSGICGSDASKNYILAQNDVWGNNTNYEHITAGETDLSTDPLFSDILSGDLTLKAGSPLLTAGEGGAQIGAYGGGGNPPAVIIAPSTIPTTSGTLSKNEIWSGNVHIAADVTVPQNVILKIDPGTTINFSDSTGLYINGVLIAAGTAEAGITFTSASSGPVPGSWKGIIFGSTALDISIIENATVEHAECGITSDYAAPLLNNILVRNNKTGIYFFQGSAKIHGCTFEDNVDYGLRLYLSKDTEIYDCAFAGNQEYGLSLGYSPGIIHGCTITKSKYGIYLWKSNVIITNNHLVRNTDGIYAWECNLTVEHNIIRGHSSCGIMLTSAQDSSIEFNTIINNGYGMNCSLYDSSCSVAVNHNIVVENDYGIRISSGTNFNLAFNDVWSNSADYYGINAGVTDLSVDPLFTDQFGNDFTLQGESPLLTAGEGGAQIGAYGNGGDPPAFTLPGSTTPTTSGELEQDERWSGEVVITADVTVPAGVVLKIDPGTTVKFDDGAGLIINGKLTAIGTEDAGILFTSASSIPSAGIWKGITFNDSSLDTNVMEYATVEYAQTGIKCSSASPSIKNTLIQNGKTGIYLSYSNAKISGCTVTSSSDYGVYLTWSSPEIDGCTVSQNASYGIYIAVASNPKIDGCKILSNSNYGIYIGSSNLSPVITNNHIAQNVNGIYAGSSRSSSTIRNNIIRDHTGYGVYLYSAKSSVIEFNTIVGNGYGIYYYLYGSSYTCTIRSNIIAENNYGIYRNNTTGIHDLGYNDVWANATNYYNITAGGGDISLDPRFVSAEDLHLGPGSPCIDRGDPYYLDEDGTRADMGAYGGLGGYNGEPDNFLPDLPVNISPADGTAGLLPSVALSAGTFSDPDATDFQTAAQWQIRTELGSYSDPTFDSGENKTNLNSIAIPCGKLQTGNSYFWRVRYKDNKNAWSDYSEETSFSTAPDLIPPETAITQGPAEGSASVANVTFKWSGTDNSGCPPVYSYRLDENEWSAFTTIVTQTFTGLSHGSHVFSVRAMDGSNNIDETPAVRNFNADIIPPVISGITVPAERIIGTSAHVLWQTDEPATSQVEYWIEGGSHHRSALDSTLKTSHDVALTGLIPNATYTATVLSRDAAGNESSSAGQPVAFTVFDDVPPEDVTNLKAQSFDTRLIFTWNHSADTYGDLAGYKIYFNGTTEPFLLGKTINTYEYTGLSPGTGCTFKITAYDTTGNESRGVSITAVTLLPNPSGLAVTPFSGRVVLNWSGISPSQYLKHYAVYVSNSELSSVEGLTHSLATTSTSAAISGLSNNVTYYFAVTAVNTSGNEKKEVTSVSAMPVPDTQGPALSDFKLNGAVFVDGGVLHRSGTFTLIASDPSGVSRMEFRLDGVLYRTDTNGADGYSCFLDLPAIADGSHVLTIMAYDSFGNIARLDYNITAALELPATPTVNSPVNGTVTNASTITVTGSAEKQTEILLFNNGAQTGGTVSVDDHGNFSAVVLLTGNQNRIQAAARNRAGMSPLTAVVLVTLDTSIPRPPTRFAGQAIAGGAVRLTWMQSQDAVKGYNLYRSTSSFTSIDQATKANSSLITGILFDDLPPGDT